jgi:hypothetical protein
MTLLMLCNHSSSSTVRAKTHKRLPILEQRLRLSSAGPTVSLALARAGGVGFNIVTRRSVTALMNALKSVPYTGLFRSHLRCVLPFDSREVPLESTFLSTEIYS